MLFPAQNNILDVPNRNVFLLNQQQQERLQGCPKAVSSRIHYLLLEKISN